MTVRRVNLSRTFVPFDYQILDECPGQSLDRFNEDEPRMRCLLRS